MDNTEYIDDYFNSSPSDNEKQQFEQRIINDGSFADEVAFYISANGIIQEQQQKAKKDRFREIYQEGKVVPISSGKRIRMITRYVAAASVVLIAVSSVLFFNGGRSNNPQQMASKYAQQEWGDLGVNMGGIADSVETGRNLAKAGKLPEALNMFEAVLKSDSSNSEAKKFAGIISYKLEQYDKAVTYFSLLAADTLQINPGKFNEAVALMKRNKAGDLEQAKKLLQEVKDSNKGESKKAAEWLEKLESVR